MEKLPGVPDMTYVTDIHPSPVDVNTVFVTLNDFQRGNFKPYVMKSTDLGRTWTSISGDLPDARPGLDHRAGPPRIPTCCLWARSSACRSPWMAAGTGFR